MLCVLYEDGHRSQELMDELSRRGIPIRKWYVSEGSVDMNQVPDKHWIYLNRLSPSASSRGHELSVEYGKKLLWWLERHGCKVINGTSAFNVETDKALALTLLSDAGIAVPRFIISFGVASIPPLKSKFRSDTLYIKPNVGGGGIGVRRVNRDELSDKYDSQNGIFIVQEGVEHATQCTKKGCRKVFYRAEYIDRQLAYIIQITAPLECMELCPCDLGERPRTDYRIVSPTDVVKPDVWHNVNNLFVNFMKENRIDVCAFEFSVPNGYPVVYDFNVNTNYNKEAESVIHPNLGGFAKLSSMVKKYSTR